MTHAARMNWCAHFVGIGCVAPSLLLLAFLDGAHFPVLHRLSASVLSLSVLVYLALDAAIFCVLKAARPRPPLRFSLLTIFKLCAVAWVFLLLLLRLAANLLSPCQPAFLSQDDCLLLRLNHPWSQQYCQSVMARDHNTTLLLDYSTCPQSSTFLAVLQIIISASMLLYFLSFPFDFLLFES